jgi:hypothetical protein
MVAAHFPERRGKRGTEQKEEPRQRDGQTGRQPATATRQIGPQEARRKGPFPPCERNAGADRDACKPGSEGKFVYLVGNRAAPGDPLRGALVEGSGGDWAMAGRKKSSRPDCRCKRQATVGSDWGVGGRCCAMGGEEEVSRRILRLSPLLRKSWSRCPRRTRWARQCTLQCTAYLTDHHSVHGSCYVLRRGRASPPPTGSWRL